MDFEELSKVFEKLESTSGRLEMTGLLSEVFKSTKPDEADKIVYLLQGVVAPPFEGIEIGMGEKLVEQAISTCTGYPENEIEKNYKKTGDLGSTAEQLIAKKKQTSLSRENLTVKKVFTSFYKIATKTGVGSQDYKIKALAELLNNANPIEAKYLVRFPIGKLRLGVGDPTIIDAMSYSHAGDKRLREDLERAYNLCSDLGLVAKIFFTEGIDAVRKFKITVFKPIRPALAERLPSAEEIISKIGRCAVEHKYDGFRIAIHKKSDRVELYSRRMEKMTAMFPELIEAVKKQIKANDAIFEGEALAVNEETDEFYPFQTTIQRKRKYGVKEMAEEYPIRLFAFDLLYADGEDFTKTPYAERRKKLISIISKGQIIKASDQVITDDAKELQKYFDDAVNRGLEGIIAKDLNAEYVTGARKFAWIKLKRSYKSELADTIDLVIVGYFKGRGARTEFGFGGFLGAVYAEESDEFKTIAKVGSGFTEEEMAKLKKMLDEIKLGKKSARVDSLLEPDVWVEPKYVVTVAADEITRSPMHTCGKEKEGQGYALRFPRLVGDIRTDKRPEDATTVAEILEMFGMQKHSNIESHGDSGA